MRRRKATRRSCGCSLSEAKIRTATRLSSLRENGHEACGCCSRPGRTRRRRITGGRSTRHATRRSWRRMGRGGTTRPTARRRTWLLRRRRPSSIRCATALTAKAQPTARHTRRRCGERGGGARARARSLPPPLSRGGESSPRGGLSLSHKRGARLDCEGVRRHASHRCGGERPRGDRAAAARGRGGQGGEG